MTGRLAIALRRDGGALRVDLAQSPGPSPARLLAGRSPAEAAALVPLVFNLCAVAQGRAARAALDLAPAAAGEEAALRQEHIRDHLHCFAVTWPALFGDGPDLGLLGQLRAPAAVLRQGLVGGAGAVDLLSPARFDGLLQRGETALFRLLGAIRRRLRPDWGRASLPAPDIEAFRARLAGEPAGPCETSALDHVGTAPLVQALEAGEGRSLFVRLVARVLDCLRMLDPRRLPAPALAPLPGLGLAPAVRGMLGHRAVVSAGRVVDYRLLSPTDWNLAPGGIMARVLDALPPGEDLPFLARLAVSVLNPCVPTMIAIDGQRYGAHA